MEDLHITQMQSKKQLFVQLSKTRICLLQMLNLQVPKAALSPSFKWTAARFSYHMRVAATEIAPSQDGTTDPVALPPHIVKVTRSSSTSGLLEGLHRRLCSKLKLQ
eukprot:scaffold41056_cov48-Prasinocladus_malaysianus.AAC.1